MKVTKLVAILNAVCTLVFFLTGSEAQEKKTAVSPGMSAVCQILTPTGGVDFSDNIKDLMVRVKRNWYAVMPEDAQLGKKGRVVVRFQIQKDGTLLVKEPTVELSSKDAQFDKAATVAIRTSAPFKPLPDAFQGPSIDLRFLFQLQRALPHAATEFRGFSQLKLFFRFHHLTSKSRTAMCKNRSALVKIDLYGFCVYQELRHEVSWLLVLVEGQVDFGEALAFSKLWSGARPWAQLE